MSQTAINQPDDPTFLVMSAATIKIPEPIILPATINVASSSPSSRFISVGSTDSFIF